MTSTIQRTSVILDENKAELRQSKMRIWHVVIGIAYGQFVDLSSLLPPNTEAVFHFYAAAFLLFVFLSYLNIRHRPGRYPFRRLVNMACDYIAFAVIMTVGEEAAMPFYALILWATLGNGMRFGQRYLLMAAIMAQMVLIALFVGNSYWRSQVELMFTFSATAIALPTYAWMLLRETSNARDAAQAATLAKSRFLAQASHDLRQPIHAVGFYIAALRNSPMHPDQVKLVDHIERALGGVSRLFKSLLDITKLDSGIIDVKPVQVEIGALINNIISENEHLIVRSGADLRMVGIDAIVDADPTLLTTMIQNMLSNAIKYSRGKKILVGVRRRGATVSVEIYDQGVGIESEHLPHIFEEFYRAKATGDDDHEGVGLGLAILQRLAMLCGFSISLRSVREIGTSVTLGGIPISTEPAHVLISPKVDASQPLAGWRVIVIEDDLDVLEATKGLLCRWGCSVQAFTVNPQAVLDADVIVSDFDLGGGTTGISVIEAVRSKLAKPIPAILMIGHSGGGQYTNEADSDVTLLTKPVEPAVLRSLLSTIRANSRFV